jgi:hypothetical protein
MSMSAAADDFYRCADDLLRRLIVSSAWSALALRRRQWRAGPATVAWPESYQARGLRVGLYNKLIKSVV